MNGPIVQNIALCLYGNAFQQNEIILDFFNNSTAQFCKKIEFSLIRKSLFGKTEKEIIYENPNNFFNKLGALYTQFSLYYESINKNDGLEERMSAGFIGGGGKWNLVSTNEKDTSVWTAFWDVIDQDNPNKKIWGVNYIKTGNQYLCNEDDENYINNFYSALEEIYNFTIKMKEKLAKKFSIISGVLALLFPLSILGIVASQISWSSSNLGLLFPYYVMLGWIPALLCSIAGIVFSILVKIDTFYMPKLHFCISAVSLFISGYWGFYVIKTAVHSALR